MRAELLLPFVSSVQHLRTFYGESEEGRNVTFLGRVGKLIFSSYWGDRALEIISRPFYNPATKMAKEYHSNERDDTKEMTFMTSWFLLRETDINLTDYFKHSLKVLINASITVLICGQLCWG